MVSPSSILVTFIMNLLKARLSQHKESAADLFSIDTKDTLAASYLANSNTLVMAVVPDSDSAMKEMDTQLKKNTLSCIQRNTKDNNRKRVVCKRK